MKLYNLYENVILERKANLLTEGIIDDVKNAMEQRVNANIYYEGSDGEITKRYVQIYDLGYTNAGNLAIIDDLPSYSGPEWNAYGNRNMRGAIQKVSFPKHGGYDPDRKIPDEIANDFTSITKDTEANDNELKKGGRRLQMPYSELPKNYYDTEEEDTY
jgi:hypothetical protein